MEAGTLRFGVQATRKKAELLTETGNVDGGGGMGGGVQGHTHLFKPSPVTLAPSAGLLACRPGR